MKTNVAVSLSALLMAGFCFIATRSNVPERAADFRDAPRDNAAMGQLKLEKPLALPVPLPAPAQGPVIVKPAAYGPGGGTKLEKIVRKVRPAVVQVIAGSLVGSGFIILTSGVVATNAHVVANVPVGGKLGIVTAASEEPETGILLVKGEKGKKDIAFVQLSSSTKVRSFLPLKPASQVSMGAEVLVMGHPLGLPFTVNKGIVSGLDRKDEYVTFLQTDASINPGNSGGPILTMDGAVIGMNTKIMFPGAVASVGLGFALIAEEIDRAWKQYLKLKNLDSPWLGVVLDPGGAVQQIIADSPAKKAGVGLEDIIIAVDGKPNNSMGDLLHQLHSHMPGDTIKLTIKRGGVLRDIPVLLEAEKVVPPQRIATVEPDHLPV